MYDKTGGYEKFSFVKSYPMSEGTVPVGSELELVYVQNTPTIYFNGGMVPPSYQVDFTNLIRREKANGWNYLVPKRAIRDKV